MFEEFQPIPQLSLSTKKLFGQPMFSLLSEAKKLEAKGKKIIHFELGDPNFESPKDAIKSACSELQSGNTHYADSQGLLELREAIASYTNKSYNFKPNLKQILVKQRVVMDSFRRVLRPVTMAIPMRRMAV